MRAVILMSLCAVAAAAAASVSAPAAVQLTRAAADRPAVEVVRMAADSLVARSRVMPDGGSAWRSSVQAPHHHTDRDVGAASVGAGLLAAYAVTHDRDYLLAARAAGDFLLGVAEPAAGGLRWPDWADPDGRNSDTHFTSFDDGAAGISDYLWTLYTVTHESRFRGAALSGMRWLVAQAKGRSCPATACSWRWTDDPAWRVEHYGVGMGQAGIVLALDTFADRTNDSTFRAYARAGAAQLRALTANGTRPLPRSSDASAAHETGFLSGSSGAAYMFLERYRRDRDPVDLATARRLLAWVDDQAVVDRRVRKAGRSPERRAPGRPRASSSESPELHGSTCRPPAPPATPPIAGMRAGPEARCGASPSATGPGKSCPAIPALRSTWDWTAAAPGSAGCSRTWPSGIDTTANRAAARTALDGLRSDARHDSLGAFWY